MIKARTLFAAHAFFFPDSAAYTIPNPGGTCGRTAKPGSTDPAWFDVGVSDWAIAPQHKYEDFKAPCPGARVLYDKLATEKGVKFKGKWMEMNNLVWQMVLATGALPLSPTAAGQYNQLEGDPVLRGWLQIQYYNQGNSLLNTMENYVAMTIPGDLPMDDKYLDVQVEADLLFSTLNTGTGA
jgi:hypothetical protein